MNIIFPVVIFVILVFVFAYIDSISNTNSDSQYDDTVDFDDFDFD